VGSLASTTREGTTHDEAETADTTRSGNPTKHERARVGRHAGMERGAAVKNGLVANLYFLFPRALFIKTLIY